jgi:UDP-MurNAc hydroxylase
MNDCQVKDPAIAEGLLKRTGPIDVLLSQFSYACWLGNPEEQEARREAGRRALRQISYQLDAFRPRYFIPSASFVLFSHEENCYLNDSINRVDAVVKSFKDRTDLRVLPMYPGDRWVIGAEHDGTEALQKYTADYERGVSTLHKSETVAWSELEQISKQRLAKLRRDNNWLFVRLASLPPVGLFCPVTVFITDYEQAVRFDIFRGIERAPEVKSPEADIAMSSGSLAFVLEHDFGFDTLFVNACFRASQKGFDRFERSVSLALLNNTGRRFSPALVFDPAFFYKAASHFFPWIHRVRKWRPA